MVQEEPRCASSRTREQHLLAAVGHGDRRLQDTQTQGQVAVTELSSTTAWADVTQNCNTQAQGGDQQSSGVL